MIVNKLHRISPAGWFILACFAGLIFLCWFAFDSDPEDTAWTDPKQPPQNVPLTMGPQTSMSGGRAVDVGAAFRGRAWPGSLTDSHSSIIGEF